MLADSASGELDADVVATTDMSTVLATKLAAGDLKLSDYLTGLGDDPATTLTEETTCVKTGCSYAFAIDGTVSQTTP